MTTSNDLVVVGYADRILNAMSLGKNHLNKGQFYHVDIQRKVMRTFGQTIRSALPYDPYKVFNLRSFVNSLGAIRYIRELSPAIFWRPQNIIKHALYGILALYSLNPNPNLNPNQNQTHVPCYLLV